MGECLCGLLRCGNCATVNILLYRTDYQCEYYGHTVWRCISVLVQFVTFSVSWFQGKVESILSFYIMLMLIYIYIYIMCIITVFYMQNVSMCVFTIRILKATYFLLLVFFFICLFSSIPILYINNIFLFLYTL